MNFSIGDLLEFALRDYDGIVVFDKQTKRPILGVRVAYEREDWDIISGESAESYYSENFDLDPQECLDILLVLWENESFAILANEV